MLDEDISAIFPDNCLTVYFHDFDNDGNDEYFVDHWLNLGFVAKEDKIRDTVCPYMQNNDSYVLSPFATVHIYYAYDSEEKAFVSDTATLSFKKPPEDGKIADKEEEVEIKGNE